MAKKNSKRSTTKPFKAIKNNTDKEIKAFLKWLEDQLSDISGLSLRVGAAIADMARFWLQEPRVDIFLGCCRDRYLFAPVYWSRIRELYDTGEFRLARPWVITFYIALHLEKSLKHRGQTPLKLELVGAICWVAEHNYLENDPANKLMVSEEPLGNAYHYAKYSRVSLAHCLIMMEAAYLNVHDKLGFFWGPYINIEVVLFEKTDQLDRGPCDLNINSLIQLKTLVMMFASGPIGDYDMAFIVRAETLFITREEEVALCSPDQFHNRILKILHWYKPTSDEKIVIQIRRNSDKLSSREKPVSKGEMSPQTNCIRRKPNSQGQVSQKNEGEHYASAGCEKPSKLKIRPSNSKKKNSRGNVDYNINDNDDRVKHSYRLGLIFEEAADIFKERRQRLNDLAIKKTAPKLKSLNKAESCVNEFEAVYHSCSLEGKAGKTCFPVLIGHEEYLYKSSKASKLSQVSPRSLDLHGCSRDIAIVKLSNSLSQWLDTAMKEHPYTLPVNIITGGGCQIISDTVEHWIRENRNVANRF